MNAIDRKPYNPCIFQGEDFSFSAVYETEDETPIDLTGYTARLTAANSYSSSTPSIDVSTSDNIVIDALTGATTVNLTNALTASLEPGEYVYDLEIESGDGTITKLLFGKILIMPESPK